METINEDDMGFNEALKILEIEDYMERILNSNSRGEVFHVLDYIAIAKVMQNSSNPKGLFREWFIDAVETAKKEWKRPESVYQHIGRIFLDFLKRVYEKDNSE